MSTGLRVTFGRCYDFTAAHRLHSTAFDDQLNAQMYGKCNNPAGHGHNYRFCVSVSGAPDPVTGMVINMTQLDAIAQNVVADFDYKHLDLQVPDFANSPSTAENIVNAIWRRFADELPAHVTLQRITVSETRNNRSILERLSPA